MTARDRILARRARFIAASLAALGAESCAPSPEPVAARHAPAASASATAAPSVSASVVTSASAAPSAVVDSDGDGIPDAEDRCPFASGVPAEDPAKHGCPKVVVSVCLSIVVLERPRFSPGSAVLGSDAAPFLDKVADVMKGHPEIEVVEVVGHCDATEKPCPDTARAATVRDALIKRGVDAGKLRTRGAGRSEPEESNDTAEGRKRNRRAELKIEKLKK